MYAHCANVSFMDKTFNDSQVVTVLLKKVKGASYRKVGAALGLSAAYICDVVKGRRGLSEALAGALGFKLVPPEKPAPRKWTAKP